MRRAFLCLILLAFFANSIAAEQVSLCGKVLDSKSKPLPYASIFLKRHPQTGSVSDDKGKFNIILDCGNAQAMDDIMRDTVIISMLGYETRYEPTVSFKGSKALTLRLKEYNYTLDEARINASRNDRKHHKSEIKKLLELIYRRLTTVDTPKGGATYRVVSDIVILRDSIPITEDHLTGSLTAIPDGRKNGKDSVSIVVSSYSNYMDTAVRKGIKNFNTDDLKKKKERDAVQQMEQKPWDKTIPHKAVWTVADVKNVLENTAGEAKYWSSTEKNENTLTVTFTRKYGFMGIVSATQRLYMTVDKSTYAITAANCDINVNLKLPFGYKLNPGELEILNMVNLDKEDIEKYKIKTARVKIRGMVINKEKNGVMTPSEKSMKNEVSIADRKDRKFDFTNTCALRVLD